MVMLVLRMTTDDCLHSNCLVRSHIMTTVFVFVDGLSRVPSTRLMDLARNSLEQTLQGGRLACDPVPSIYCKR